MHSVRRCAKPKLSAVTVLLALGGVLCFHGFRGSWLESEIMDSNIGKIMTYGATAMVAMIALKIKEKWTTENELLREVFGQKWNEWAKVLYGWYT